MVKCFYEIVMIIRWRPTLRAGLACFPWCPRPSHPRGVAERSSDRLPSPRSKRTRSEPRGRPQVSAGRWPIWSFLQIGSLKGRIRKLGPFGVQVQPRIYFIILFSQLGFSCWRKKASFYASSVFLKLRLIFPRVIGSNIDWVNGHGFRVLCFDTHFKRIVYICSKQVQKEPSAIKIILTRLNNHSLIESVE